MNINDVCIELHNMVKNHIAVILTDITSALSFLCSGNGGFFVSFFVVFFLHHNFPYTENNKI